MGKLRMQTWLVCLLLLLAAGCGQQDPQMQMVPPTVVQQTETPSIETAQTEAVQPPAQTTLPGMVQSPAETAPEAEVVPLPPAPQVQPDAQPTAPPPETNTQPEAPVTEPQPQPEPETSTPPAEPVYIQPVPMPEAAPEEEAAALQEAPAAVATTVKAVASGTLEKRTDKAVIDYSNTGDGYVMVQYIPATDRKLKCRVTGPATTYTYNLLPGQWATFSLSDGDGNYTVAVFENVVDSKYATVLSVSFDVKTQDPFAPFLLPNQYVDYENAPNTVAKAQELTAGLTAPLKQVEAVYDFVVANLTYDKQLAQTVQSGYLPVLDTVLEKKTGICFDYAALMTGMLRSRGIPCKLVVGYAGQAYHAWISVWTEETGWVDGVIFFDGHAWKRMDPTFASSANGDAEILQYIGDGTNYTEKYVY